MSPVSPVFHTVVVSIEFSPLSTVELTTNWYQLHNGDYREILEDITPKHAYSLYRDIYFTMLKLLLQVRIGVDFKLWGSMS